MKKIVCLVVLASHFICAGQNVGIGTITPDGSAQLDITHTSKGLLIPRMNTAAFTSISNPAKGLMVYDSTTNQLMINMGNASSPDWRAVVINCGWGLSGNRNTNAVSQFIGTIDNNPLRFRLNNNYSGGIDSVHAKTFLGYGAGARNSSGYSNVAIGQKSFTQNVSGYGNTVVGDSAAFSDTSSFYNTVLGATSFYSNKFVTGSKNTAIGASTLFYQEGYEENTAIGYGSMAYDQIMSFNTATGKNASSQGAYFSSSIGTTAGARSYGTASGFSAGGGNNSSGVGAHCLRANSMAGYNTASGYAALGLSDAGGGNVANGSRALYNGDNNAGITANGYKALYYTNGYDDVGSGQDNTATGSEALYNNSAGYRNTATGRQALYSNLLGYQNTGAGVSALYRGNGISNTAIGYEAMYFTSNSNLNVAIGEQSMYLNTGFQNTSVGYALLNTSASHNTVVGYNTAVNYSLGDNNSILGANCTVTGLNYFNCTVIGEAVTGTASNQARIGNSYTTSIGGYANWTSISDGHFKKDIKEDVKGLDFILKLKPVTYHLDVRNISQQLNEKSVGSPDSFSAAAIEEKERTVFSGFIAQQVEEAALKASYVFSGINKPTSMTDPYGLRYDDFVVPLVKAMQEQQLALYELKKRNTEIIKINDEQEDLYKKSLKKIERLEASSTASKN